MKAVKKFSDGGVHFKLVEEPEPELLYDTDVKIRIDAIGICTSDLHVLHGAMQMPDGNTVGHEFSGRVTEVGNTVHAVSPGDKVVCELAKGACGTCRACRSGHHELCPSKTPPGWVSQGVYAEYTVQPEFCVHRIPDGLSMEVAAMAEPFAVCVYGCMERGRIRQDDFTVIYGMGSIGLFTLVSLLDFGVRKVVCVARGGKRARLAGELGASAVLPAGEDIPEQVKRGNDGWGADCVIDCSGSPDAINQGLGVVRKGGRFVSLGLTGDSRIPFAYNQAVLGVIEMVCSASSSRNAWNKAIGILVRNEAAVKKVITHGFRLEDWQSAYEKLASREAVKSVLING